MEIDTVGCRAHHRNFIVGGHWLFERTGDMVFALEWQTVGKKMKQVPVIRRGKGQL